MVTQLQALKAQAAEITKKVQDLEREWKDTEELHARCMEACAKKLAELKAKEAAGTTGALEACLTCRA